MHLYFIFYFYSESWLKELRKNPILRKNCSIKTMVWNKNWVKKCHSIMYTMYKKCIIYMKICFLNLLSILKYWSEFILQAPCGEPEVLSELFPGPSFFSSPSHGLPTISSVSHKTELASSTLIHSGPPTPTTTHRGCAGGDSSTE